MTAAVQEAFPKLRYIGLFATGYNNVDTEQAKKRGIAVCNVPGYSTEAVAQMVFSHILLIASSIDRYTADTRAGKWVNYPVFTMLTHPMEELSGKTLGIFGYGSIGKRVAEIGAAFGMKVLVHTRTERPGCPFPYVDAHTLLSSADYLSLNAPLNAQTARFINEESIREMKDGAVLINTARGGLVDEEALRRLCAGENCGRQDWMCCKASRWLPIARCLACQTVTLPLMWPGHRRKQENGSCRS